jgi:predicted RNA binding protein YcfA (HicA-like mRNA interferase family)
LAEALGFEYVGGEGSHRIYAYPGQPEQLNLQPLNGQAKPYQLRQLLRLIDRYGLALP